MICQLLLDTNTTPPFMSITSENVTPVLLAPKNLYLGAGIIVNGQLIRGDKHMAGEVSFISSNVTREEALTLMADEEFFMNSLTTAITAIISVINPTRMVIAGNAISEDMKDIIYDNCLNIIPEVFMPELEVIPDTDKYFMNGIITLALNNTTTGLKLIANEL